MFGKYFASTFTGSMVGSGLNVFAVWGYVIANTRADGYVELNPPLLAAIMGCTVGEVTAAIDFLKRPDPDSRNKVQDGRRLIQEAAFLYFVPTYSTYRGMRDDDDRAEYMRDYMRAYRARQKGEQGSVNVNVNHGKPPLAHAEAEAEAEAGKSKACAQRDSANRPAPASDDPPKPPKRAKEAKPPAPPIEPADIVCTLPLIDGSDFTITKQHLAIWVPAYPAVEIRQQLRRAKAWLVSNPKNRKTARGILRFVNTWMAKEQDRAIPIAQGESRERTSRTAEALLALDAIRRQPRLAGRGDR